MDNVGLEDLVTERSVRLFEIFDLPDYSFISKDATEWSGNASYIQCKQLWENLKVVNDVAERGVSLIQQINLRTQNEQQKQALLLEVHKHQKDVPNANKAGETLYECVKIDYFTKEEYSPDPNDSTMAIPYAVTKSVFFFAAATFLLMAAYCCCIMGHCVKQRGLYTFVSGVAFIVTGLIMLFGLIMYISIFKAEVGGKLRPRSQLQPPAFTYSYGFSFLLYVLGFISTQLAGISSIFLFIYKMQYDYRLKHLDDLRRGKLRPPSTVNYVPLEQNTFYPCRRHPQAYINSNSIHIPTNYPSPAHQRRYFFSKEPVQESPCSLHRARSQANSLKEVSNFYDFPPPPTISYQFDDRGQFNRDSMRMFPRDVTTNTVSTTADVVDDFIPDHFEDYSPSIQHEHEFVTFDLDQPLPLRTQSTVSINSRNGRKDFANDSLRRTTPV